MCAIFINGCHIHFGLLLLFFVVFVSSPPTIRIGYTFIFSAFYSCSKINCSYFLCYYWRSKAFCSKKLSKAHVEMYKWSIGIWNAVDSIEMIFITLWPHIYDWFQLQKFQIYPNRYALVFFNCNISFYCHSSGSCDYFDSYQLALNLAKKSSIVHNHVGIYDYHILLKKEKKLIFVYRYSKSLKFLHFSYFIFFSYGTITVVTVAVCPSGLQ